MMANHQIEWVKVDISQHLAGQVADRQSSLSLSLSLSLGLALKEPMIWSSRSTAIGSVIRRRSSCVTT